MKKTYKMIDLECANCAAKMEAAIKKLPGVNDASVSFLSQKLMLDAELEMPHDGGRRCFWWMTLITGSSCAGWFGACGKNCRRRKGRIQRNHRFRGRGFQRRTASLLAHDFPGKV